MTTPNAPVSSVSPHQYHNRVCIAADYIVSHLGKAELAIVLGSGLMGFTKFLRNAKSLSFSSIPHVPMTTVSGHTGELVHGELDTKAGPQNVYCFAGRVHAYEGWRPHEVNFMVRMAAVAGARVMILTNSAGGCLPGMSEGSVMLISDHVRLTHTNPLRDTCDDSRFGPRHLKSDNSYSKKIANWARTAASKLRMPLHTGVYCWTSGPTYETHAEVQAAIRLGCGALGMSTVPEVLAASSMGMEVFAISLATNLAAGLADEKLTHDAVKEVANSAGPKFQNLLIEMFSNFDMGSGVGSNRGLTGASHAVHGAGMMHNAAHSGFISLQPMVGWNPSLDQITLTADFLHQANAYQPDPAVAVFLSGHAHSGADTHHHHPFISRLSARRVLPLCDLPPFKSFAPYASTSARAGWLTLGTAANGVRVVAVTGLRLEGLAAQEASLLLQAFAVMGVTSVFMSLVAAKPPQAPAAVVAAVAAFKSYPSSSAAAPSSPKGSSSSSASTSTPRKSSASFSAPPAINPSATVLLLTDIFDRTTDIAPLVISKLSSRRRYDVPVFDSEFLQLAEAKLAAASPPIVATTGSFLAFPGPSLPTPSEAQFTVISHSAGYGITNPAPLEIGKALGMRVFGIARLCNTAGELEQKWDHTNSDASIQQVFSGIVEEAKITSNPALEFKRTDNAAAAASSPVPTSSISAIAPVKKPASTKPAPVAPADAGCPPIPTIHRQESYVNCLFASLYLQGKFGIQAPVTGIFLESSLNEVLALAEFKCKLKIPAKEVPHWKELANATTYQGSQFPYPPYLANRWTFSYGTIDDHIVLVVSDETGHPIADVPVLHGLGMAVRMLKTMRMHNMLLLAPITSTTPDLSVGDLAIVQDHINLTGHNSLFGDNEPKWGARFSDMGHAYSVRMREVLKRTEVVGVNVKETTVVQVNSPAYDSAAEARFVSAIGGSSLVAGFAPLTILARHMELNVAAVAYVSRAAVGADGEASDVYRAGMKAGKAAMKGMAALVKAAVQDSAAVMDELKTFPFKRRSVLPHTSPIAPTEPSSFHPSSSSSSSAAAAAATSPSPSESSSAASAFSSTAAPFPTAASIAATKPAPSSSSSSSSSSGPSSSGALVPANGLANGSSSSGGSSGSGSSSNGTSTPSSTKNRSPSSASSASSSSSSTLSSSYSSYTTTTTTTLKSSKIPVPKVSVSSLLESKSNGNGSASANANGDESLTF